MSAHWCWTWSPSVSCHHMVCFEFLQKQCHACVGFGYVCVCVCMWAYPTMSQLCVNYTALTLSGRSPTTLSVVSMASFVVCTVRHHSGLCTYPRAHLNVKISYSPLGKTVKMVIVNTQKYTQYSHNSRTLRENKVQGRWSLLEFVLLLQIAALVHVHYTRWIIQPSGKKKPSTLAKKKPCSYSD